MIGLVMAAIAKCTWGSRAMKTALILLLVTLNIPIVADATNRPPHTERPECCHDIRGCGRRDCN